MGKLKRLLVSPVINVLLLFLTIFPSTVM